MFKVNNNIAATNTHDIVANFIIITNFAQNLIPVLQLCVNGQNVVQYYGTFIQNMIPDWIKDSETLNLFKDKMQKWNPIVDHYVSRLQKVYTKFRYYKSDLILYCCLWSSLYNQRRLIFISSFFIGFANA